MEKNSKCAIYKLKECTNKQGQTFYEAVVVENIYNPSKPFNWEMSFIKCNIFTNLPLEIASFDLQNNKNQLSFDNISNPEHSIIRVLDFSVENQTVWKKTKKNGKDYYEQQKTNEGKPLISQKFYIKKCEFDTPDWKAEESKIKFYDKRFLEQEQRIANLKAKIHEYSHERTLLKKTIDRLKTRLVEGKETVKVATSKFDMKKEKPIGNYEKVEFEDM